MQKAPAAVGVIVVALGLAAPTSATVPGADGLIGFDSDRDGNTEIYSMNPDGSGQTRLTNSLGSDQNPAWSPEGNRIAFASTRDGNSEIYVMAFDGSGQTRLTTNPATDSNPTWSPNGQIAFQSNRDGNVEIYKMNADGSGQTRLTNNPASDFRPSWSPDGNAIAFGSARDGQNEIYKMNADGSGQTRLTNNPASDQHPAWLANGTQLVFVRTTDIVRMSADGSGQTPLTNTANNSDPAGSPGNRVVFRSSRDGNSEIYVMGADGSGQARLTVNPAADATPDWQGLNRAPVCANATQTTRPNTALAIQITCTDPDGNPLTYVNGSPGSGRLSGLTQVTQANGLSPFLQPSGFERFTYTPNNDFLGNDAIGYTVSDQRGGIAPVAQLTLQVLPPAIPSLQSFSFIPKSIRVGSGSTPTSGAAPKGGAFSYRLSIAARVTIEIERTVAGRRSRGRCKTSVKRGARCTIFQFKGTLTRGAVAGNNRTTFTGRIGRKALPLGSYLATITPFSAIGEAGVPRTASFKIVKK